MEYKNLEDIFDENRLSYVQQNQEEYISSMKTAYKNLLVLRGSHEKDAIPELKMTNRFLKKLLKKKDAFGFLGNVEDIRNYLMQQYFPQLCSLILKVNDLSHII